VLDGLAPQTIVEIGSSAPPVLAALLATRFPGARLLGLHEGPGPRTHCIRDHDEGGADIEVEVAAADPERDRWPWDDGSIDLVVGIEVLQRFALDPHHALAEANRVLAPGGHLLLTTPNIASHRAVARVLGLEAPYASGGFAPAGGVSARHNREYAPREVPLLGEAAGFGTVRLSTHDMGGSPGEGIDPATAGLLARQGHPLELRGETILYLGRKDGPPRGAPERFYTGDPTSMAGRLALADGPDPEGGADIALTNTSTGWWTVEGPHRTTLVAEWLDAEGRYHGRRALPGPDDPVPPGATAHVTLAVDGAPEGSTPGRIRLHLCQEGAGPFSGTGRAAPLELPCSREAFDRLGRQA
jgi:SAM-dependent methyltransferase